MANAKKGGAVTEYITPTHEGEDNTADLEECTPSMDHYIPGLDDADPDKPKPTQSGPGLITLVWPTHGIIIDITEFGVGSFATLTVWEDISDNGKPTLIAQDRIDLLSPSQKQAFIRQLYAVRPKPKDEDGAYYAPWERLLRFVVFYTTAKIKQGEPVREIYTTVDVDPPEMLLGVADVWGQRKEGPPVKVTGGLLYKGHQTILFGPKGVKKSTLAYTLAVCLALPWRDNPLGLTVPKRSMKVLVLDWETNQDTFSYYINCLRRGMDLPLCSIFYRHCSLPLAHDVDTIQQYLDDTGAEIAIIDSLSAAAGGEHGELKGSAAALAYNAGLRRLKCSNRADQDTPPWALTTLAIGQTSKGAADGDDGKTVYGSTLFSYYARTIIEIDSRDGAELGGQVHHVGLLGRECNLGPRIGKVGIRVEYADDKAITLEREPYDTAQFMDKLNTQELIPMVLKEGAANTADLVERTGKSRAAIDMALKRLRAGGRVIDTGGKKWGLPVV